MILWTDYTEGDYRTSCPNCGRGGRDKTLGVTVAFDGRGVAHCFRCGHVETFRPEAMPMQRARRIVPPEAASKHETLSDYGRGVWSACRPIEGPARAYLEARCCALPPDDGDLRFHPALKHPNGHVGPALVALITDAVKREPMSLHRTWIRADGTKADVDPPRMLLGGHRKAGGVIRLWPDECVTTGLMIGEGVETVLAAARHYRPAWAAIDAGNLASLSVLSGIEVLVIAADHDDAGLKAANECADRWAAVDVEVHVIAPARERADWNDMEAAA